MFPCRGPSRLLDVHPQLLRESSVVSFTVVVSIITTRHPVAEHSYPEDGTTASVDHYHPSPSCGVLVPRGRNDRECEIWYPPGLHSPSVRFVHRSRRCLFTLRTAPTPPEHLSIRVGTCRPCLDRPPASRSDVLRRK